MGPYRRFSRRWSVGWLFVTFLVITVTDGRMATAEEGWKAGVARAVITPQRAMWMAGYGGRTEPAHGKYHDLWLRVLALEAADGSRGVVVSTDTLGISRTILTEVLSRVETLHGLSADQVTLHASHTHCGPVLRRALRDIYPLTPEHQGYVDEYSRWLTDTLVSSIGEALAALQPVTLSHGVGSCDFAVNRRTNREPDVPQLREQNLLLGPVDHTVPVLSVRRTDGSPLAILFAYACHNTVLSWQQWCGDYAGFAQYALEDRYPGCTAMFAMGCGADQNPLPRRTVELAQAYGTRLADSVDAVLKTELTPVAASLLTAQVSTPLAYGPLPPEEKMRELAAGREDYVQRWASRLLKQRDDGQPWETEYAYPVQAWRLGEDLLWISLGGEVVVDYSLRLKAEHGWETWVLAYANDVMAYIPSERVLLEGGYEGQSSMYVYGLPCDRWAPGLEARIGAAVAQAVARVSFAAGTR
jgi:hypothetical protein